MCTLAEMRAIRSELDATAEVKRRVALHAQCSDALVSWKRAFDRFSSAVHTLPLPRWTGRYKADKAGKSKSAPKRKTARKASPARRRPAKR